MWPQPIKGSSNSRQRCCKLQLKFRGGQSQTAPLGLPTTAVRAVYATASHQFIRQKTRTHLCISIYKHNRAHTHIPVVLLQLKGPIDLFRETGLVSAWPPTELGLVLQNSPSTRHEGPEERWLNDSLMYELCGLHQLIIPESLTNWQLICCQAINIVHRKTSKYKPCLVCDALWLQKNLPKPPGHNWYSD